MFLSDDMLFHWLIQTENSIVLCMSEAIMTVLLGNILSRDCYLTFWLSRTNFNMSKFLCPYWCKLSQKGTALADLAGYVLGICGCYQAGT